MIHFLRKDGKTIVDIETSSGDIRCVVVIKEYSKLLRDAEGNDIIDDFDDIQEIRAEYWETYNGVIDADMLARKKLINLANKYNLDYTTD